MSGHRTAESDPAFISGTSSEFLGRKPLPRAVRSRPVIFILGPKGVGKSVVARRLLGDDAVRLDSKELADRVARTIRSRRWEPELQDCENLILDAPYFISRRPGYQRSIARLLNERVERGHRTVLLESQDMASLQRLMDTIALDHRATVSLRFPVGRGRRRYALKLCEELNMDTSHARQAMNLDPWSYTAVRDSLVRILESDE